MAYKTGFYSEFLKTYLEYFDRDQLGVYFFEDLKKDPIALMQKTALDLGVDPDFYTDYSFDSHNVTVQVRSPLMEKVYGKIRSGLMYSVYKYPLAYKIIMRLQRVITPVYKKLNSKELQKDSVPESEIQYLKELYAKEGPALAELTGLRIPWMEHSLSDA